MGLFSDNFGDILKGSFDVAGSMLNSWYQNKQNKKAQERDQRFQQYMWNNQNEYNLPINQVERLRQAGLSPQLALGDVNSVASASLGGQSPTSYPSAGLGTENLGLLAKASMIAGTQLDREKANTERVAQSQMQAQTSNTKEQTKFLSSQIKNIDADTKLKLLNYQLENIKRQSGIVGNDMLSNVARSSYGFGQRLGQGLKKIMNNLKLNFDEKVNEYHQSEFYKNRNNK